MKTLRDDFDHNTCVRSEAKNVADSRVEGFSLSMRRMSASDDQMSCRRHTWELRHLNSRDSCSEDDSRSEEDRVFHFSRSTTLRLVFDGTLFDRERNLLKRMTQIDVETTIRVMTTRNQMKNRNDSSNQQSIEKEEIQQLLSELFLDDSNDDHHSQFTTARISSIDSTYNQLSHGSSSSRKSISLQISTTSFSYCCMFLILMNEQQTEYSAKTSSRWLYVGDMTKKSLVQRRSFYSSEGFLFHVIYSSSRMNSLKWMTKRVWIT
jgi:hypothetical protein